MKKQIFILTFLSLAFLFAGVNKSFGQTVYADYVDAADATSVACTPAIPLNCIADADALHPLPGVEYTYSITTDPTTVQSIHWFVTDVSDVIAVQNALTGSIDLVDGDYVLTASASYNDVTTPNTSTSVDISWKSFDGLANEVLLVAYVTGAAGCSDNIEVYRIEPEFGFTLDVAGLLDDGTLGDEECVSPVESAIYDGTNLTTDYGENWVFFSVNAANFVDSWEPTFTAAVTGGSTIGAIEWAYPAQAILNAAGVSTGTWNASGVPVQASAGAGGAVGSDGECIVVRVQVEHNAVENDDPLAPPVVTLSIDGVMFDPAAASGAEYDNGTLADLDEPASGTGDCVNNITDTADYTLTPRPDITTTTPFDSSVPTPTPIQQFEPKN